MTMHSKGLLLTSLGILLISPDSLLIRLIGMDVFSTAAWRGGLQSIGLVVILLAVYGTKTPAVFRAIGWTGLLISVITIGTNFAFVSGIKFTSVANALVILASTPFHAAIMSRVFLGERIALRTWLAIIVGMSGVALIVWDGFGRGSSFGDGMALLAALLLAGKLTLMRGRRQVNMIPAVTIGAALFSVTAMLIGGPPTMPNEMQALWIVIMGFVVAAPATALLALGPRYISSPEVGLLVLLETVLGPIWVWIVIHEAPTSLALVGGAIVIMTLLAHSLLSLRAHNRARSVAAA